MSETSNLRRVKVHFPEISPKTWEHPTDRAALTALKKVPGLDLILQKLIGVTTEKSLRLITLASAVRVSRNQFPKLHELHREACAVFDLKEMPELYVSQSPFLNAGAIGVQNPFIVLNSSLIETMSEDEILYVLGHELGHCMSGHVLYKTLLALLVRLSVYALSVPVGGASLFAIIAALREWSRKAELSCDRAGLLAVQDPTVPYSLLMKFAGGKNVELMDSNEFFRQAEEYERSGTVVDSIHKLLNLVGQSHPFPVLRLTELKSWVDRGDFTKILNGEYLHREQDKEDDVAGNFRKAKDQYKEDLNTSEDPLADFLRNAYSSTEGARNKAKDFFESIFGGQNNGKKE